MARKKRRFDQVPQQQASPEPTDKTIYRDPFQDKVGRAVEDLGKKLEGQGKNILYGLGAIAVIAVIIWIAMVWMGRSNAEAQAALGKAIETSQARITDIGPPAGSEERTFKTQAERASAAIAEFNAVAEKFGGEIGQKARYFAAVNRLVIDREAGIAELEALTGTGGETGTLAKFALAQARADNGQLDVAAAIYQELSAASDPVLSRETIQYELALILEKQEKKEEAANVLFELVKAANEAKGLDGKPVPLSSTARSAKDKLEILAPEKAKELPEPAFELPF
ncbi:MAG TPA: hypothetical protein PKD24_09730 [Pyrinomonadaceae bacterium]|mgnify:CR=1 FL=1|nr:hypothetical protein [Pyrinomonadaceae bacterium]HMP65651.1 hypothetical protein [Pyrinomonadaceae bacterium]